MHPRVEEGHLSVAVEDGPTQKWKLPVDKTHRAATRRIRDEAVGFAQANGATVGQKHAVMKALTEAGFYVTRRAVEGGQS